MALSDREMRVWGEIEARLRADTTFRAAAARAAARTADTDDERPSAVAALLGRIGLALLIGCSAVLCAGVAVAVLVGVVALASTGPVGWPTVALLLVVGTAALGIHQLRTLRTAVR